MKKKLIMLCSTLIALILEILPYGAVCNFANPEGAPWHRTYSYFDLTPFGYAHFSPFIVALLTCILIILIIISIVSSKLMRGAILPVSISAALLSFAPLLLGINFFSIVGAFISVALSITFVMSLLSAQ